MPLLICYELNLSRKEMLKEKMLKKEKILFSHNLFSIEAKQKKESFQSQTISKIGLTKNVIG